MGNTRNLMINGEVPQERLQRPQRRRTQVLVLIALFPRYVLSETSERKGYRIPGINRNKILRSFAGV